MASPGDSSATFTVLLVCTGNICRSPFAERLARAVLHERLGDSAGAIRMVSAGTRAVVGARMHPDSALVLRGYGAEAGDFRAQQLHEALIAQADLTLTMTREHRGDVLERAPRSLGRTFTLREAAALLSHLSDQVGVEGSSFPARAHSLVAALAAARGRRFPGDDDVPDPIGQPIEVHQEVGESIADALLPVLERLANVLEAQRVEP